VSVRPQSCLLPAALLIYMFFCTNVYSEKKNSVHKKEADRGVKFYNSDYKKKGAGNDGDIISYNSRTRNPVEDDDSAESENLKTPDRKKALKNDSKKKSPRENSVQFVYYIVKTGDTLFGIAKRSGISLKTIQDINNLDEDAKIYKGMKLKVPSGKEIKKNKSDSSQTASTVNKPGFLWPMKKVKSYSSDGKDGVKPIGIVIKGNPGSEVIASEAGVVKKVGYMRGYGKYIVVKHEKKYITVYSNLMDVDVKAGDSVQKGGRIGNISDDMTLHFQIDRGGKPENPVNLLPGKG